MTGSELVTAIAEALSDTGHARWSEAQLRRFVNQTMREIVALRPDANTRAETTQLAKGAEQSLPAGALRFLGGLRNMGSDGSTPGKDLRNTDKATKDAVSPSWYTASPAAEIDECIYDDNVPATFWVWPPAPDPGNTQVHLAIKVSKAPTEVTQANEDQDVDLSAEYEEPIILGALARAYRINTDAGSQRLAQSLHQRMRQSLGLQAKIADNQPPRSKGDSS